MSKTRQEQVEVIMKQLQWHKDNGSNMLMPSVKLEVISEFHSPVLEAVNLNPNPQGEDIYLSKQVRGNFVLHKKGLFTLARCACIIWDTYQTGKTPDSDRWYVEYQALGGVCGADGSITNQQFCRYPIDLLIIKEEFQTKWEGKADERKALSVEGKKAFIRHNVDRELRIERHNALKKAETGAKCRVIRDILGTNNTYSKDELSKPFVTIRYEFKPDMDDPIVKRALLDNFLQSKSLFGSPKQIAAPMVNITPTEKIPFPDEEEPEKTPPPDDDGGPYTEGPDDPLTPEEEAELDFNNMDPEYQVKELEQLIKLKAFEVTWKAPLKDFDRDQKMGFFRKLITLPDVEDDDIPF